MNNQEKNSYVRKQILNTLLDMMKTEDFDSIVISRLVQKAEIGRASFYRNYTSKEDVLRQESARLKKEFEAAYAEDDPSDIRLRLIRTLDFFKKHSEFYLTIYRAGLTQIIQDFIVDKNAITPDTPSVMAYALSAFSYLIYGWVIEWIRRGMIESVDEILAMFEKQNNSVNRSR